MSDEVDLRLSDVTTIMAKRKWTVVNLALLVTAASLASAWLKPTTYSSTATIVLVGASQTSVQAQQSQATAKHLAESRTVAAIVADRLHRAEPAEALLDGLSVSVPTGTQLLSFRYTGAQPGDATALAQGFADAFRDYQSKLLDDLVASSRALEQISDDLRSRLAAAETKVETAPTAADAVDARINVDSLADQLRTVEQQRTSLLGSAPVTSTEAEAASPAVRNAPPLKRGAMAGAAAGLVLGAAVALAVEALARRRRGRRLHATPAIHDAVPRRRDPVLFTPSPARSAMPRNSTTKVGHRWKQARTRTTGSSSGGATA